MTRRQIGAVKECVGSGLWRAQEARYSRGGGGASDGEKRGSAMDRETGRWRDVETEKQLETRGHTRAILNFRRWRFFLFKF